MILLVPAALAFLLSIVILIIDLLILKIVLSAFIFLLLILQAIRLRKGAVKTDQDSIEKDLEIDLEDENRRLSKRLEEIEKSYRTLSQEKTEMDSKVDTLLEDAAYLCSALPLMRKLAELVISKTEESAMNLTESIFQISNKSSQVGGHISNFLNDLFSGEKSLKSNIDVLNREMLRIESLIEDFNNINKQYTVDMRHIEENVAKINNFLSGIRDVSDRTGLLAINSSIEAARVGSAGKGFSVLAGEIQGLASSSKDLSLQIDEVVEGISARVGESFHSLEAEISKTLTELSQTQKDLKEISQDLDGKIIIVESHVKDSETLSKTVTEQLNNVSVNMQYQDITRQILEHIMSVLNFYRTQMEEKEPRLIAESDSREKVQKILEHASSYFTIEDEWRLFDLQAAFNAVETSSEEDDFKGDVELF